MLKRLTAAALLLAAPALAQTTRWSAPPDNYIFKPGSEIDAAISKPEGGHAYGTLAVNDHENYFVEFLKRLDHGNMVERHTHSIDQVTIIAGQGVLTYGGTIQGGATTPNGETRGGTQVGAKTQALAPGDFVLIPAGMAHKFDAAPGKTLTYVVAKARQ